MLSENSLVLHSHAYPEPLILKIEPQIPEFDPKILILSPTSAERANVESGDQTSTRQADWRETLEDKLRPELVA